MHSGMQIATVGACGCLSWFRLTINVMRTLAWILGLIAFGGSLFLAITELSARRGERQASVAVRKAQEDLSNWQVAAQLEIGNRRAKISNDNLRLSNDDLAVQIAELQGRGVADAQAKRNTDRMQLRTDENMQDLDELESALGPGPQVSSAMDRLQTAQRSLGVYSAVLTRNEHLAYAAGALWLAFGFAVAFAVQRHRLDS
jgi:hypothetical protein